MGKVWKFRKKLGKNWKFGDQFETQKKNWKFGEKIGNLKKLEIREKIWKKIGILENLKMEIDYWIIDLT